MTDLTIRIEDDRTLTVGTRVRTFDEAPFYGTVTRISDMDASTSYIFPRVYVMFDDGIEDYFITFHYEGDPDDIFYVRDLELADYPNA